MLQSSELSVSTDEGHRGSWILHLYGASDDLAVSVGVLVTRGHSDTDSFFCCSGCAELHSTSDSGTLLDLLHMCCGAVVTQACKPNTP